MLVKKWANLRYLNFCLLLHEYKMKPLFLINTDKAAPTQAVLAIEAGRHHISWAITSSGGNGLYRLGYFQADGAALAIWENLLDEEPALRGTFYDVQICWAFSPAVMMPASGFETENAGELFRVLHGPTGYAPVITESVPVWQVQTVYSVPAAAEKKIKEFFPAARTRNLFSLLLQNPASSGDEGRLKVDFRTDELTVLLIRAGQLLLAQTYSYKTPEDVIYYLIRSCNRFGLSRQDIKLSLSGLIDPDSALYREILLYFRNVETADSNWQDTGYPAHYFTSLNVLAACAS